MSIRIFLTVGNAIEVIQRWVLSDDPALRKYWVLVLDRAEWLDGMILLDVICRREKLVELSAADRIVSNEA